MTTTGGLHEQSANEIIGHWLGQAGRNWQVAPERTGRIKDSNERPDVIIVEGDRMPVAVEREFDDRRPWRAYLALHGAKYVAGNTPSRLANAMVRHRRQWLSQPCAAAKRTRELRQCP